MAVLTWSNSLVGDKGAILSPYGSLFDSYGVEIEEKVFWCNTETGEIRHYPDPAVEDRERPGHCVWHSAIRFPPLTFIKRQEQ